MLLINRYGPEKICKIFEKTETLPPKIKNKRT